jgi:hypothetical protein
LRAHCLSDRLTAASRLTKETPSDGSSDGVSLLWS